MTGTNHVLTGIAIGLIVQEPVLAIPLAVVSHFVLDSLPHYGSPDVTNKRFLVILGIDGAAISIILFSLAIAQPAYWEIAAVCGIAAASLDFMWLPNFLRDMKTGHVRKPYTNPILRFHKNIQWAEKPYNWPYEFVWLFIVSFTVAKLANFL